jgi:hypothetical protein
MKLKIFIFTVLFVSIFTACKSLPEKNESVSPVIAQKGVKTRKQLVSFFLSENPSKNKAKVKRLAKYYIEEAGTEGINSDVAFVQMCLETGFLRFGNLVTEDMNNFCGLGAIDAENRGLSFATEKAGVRAHIQHLHAYGSTMQLKNECIDPRYKYVLPRGKAPDVTGLAGTWASDREYGKKLTVLLKKLETF